MINFIIIRTVTGIHPFIQTFALSRTFYSLFRPFFSLTLFVRVNIIKTLLSGTSSTPQHIQPAGDKSSAVLQCHKQQ